MKHSCEINRFRNYIATALRIFVSEPRISCTNSAILIPAAAENLQGYV